MGSFGPSVWAVGGGAGAPGWLTFLFVSGCVIQMAILTYSNQFLPTVRSSFFKGKKLMIHVQPMLLDYFFQYLIKINKVLSKI